FTLRPHWMHFEFAEQTAERDVLRRREILVTQHKHLVLNQRRFERLERVSIHTGGEVEPVDFCAQRRAQALDLKRCGKRRISVGGELLGCHVDVHDRTSLLSRSIMPNAPRLRQRASDRQSPCYWGASQVPTPPGRWPLAGFVAWQPA